MTLPVRIIHIQPDAPVKPAVGSACNGCGVCCLAEPCPLGILLSRRRHGVCMALRWDALALRYQCGAITDSGQVAAQVLPSAIVFVANGAGVVMAKLAKRWIAAGVGCDSDLEPQVRDSGTMRHD